MATSIDQTLKTLKSKRTAFKAQITRFRHAIDKYREDGNLVDLKTRNDRIIKLFDAYDEVQSELETLDDVQPHLDERYAVEDEYLSALSCARGIIEAQEAQSGTGTSAEIETQTSITWRRSNTNDNEIHLPRINLPTFGGSYEDWPGFADQFKLTIHENRHLNDCKRLTYLRSCLIGEAATSIASLGTSASNYAAAWSILEERYNEPSVIVNQHLRALFEIPKMNKASYHELTTYLNIAVSHTEALETLKQPTKDTMLIYLLTSRLDSETEMKWREYTQNTPFPILKQFLQFVNDRRRLLIPSGSEPRNAHKNASTKLPVNANTQKPAREQPRTNNRDIRAQPQHAFVANTVVRCNICQEAHYTSNCKKLHDANIEERKKLVNSFKLCMNCLRPNHNAKECRSSKCRKCNANHHTILHEDTSTTNTPVLAKMSKSSTRGSFAGILATAVVDVRDHQGNFHPCRILLDPGSQVHFVSKEMSEKLRLDQKRVNMPVIGIHNMNKIMTHSADVHLKSRTTKFTIDINCLILDSLNHVIPTNYIDRTRYEIPKNVKLADPQFHNPRPIDAILGVQVYHRLLCVGKISLADDTAALTKTKLGWVLTGDLDDTRTTLTRICKLSIHALDHSVKKFWEIEETPIERIFSHEENSCEEHYKTHTQRDSHTGKYIVRLPLKHDRPLGESYTTALKRFYSLEKSLAKNPDRKEQYAEFLREYLELGHMTEHPNSCKNEGYYLPHHAVIKSASLTTKLRVVFDGSARTSSGNSLNDTLMVGPTIQDDLFSLTIRFRSHAYVLTADIAKMYRQVMVHPEDRKYQKILWRDHSSQPVKTYELNTVTYGTSAAPFLAIRSLRQLADDEAEAHSKAAAIVKSDFYVDDLLTGANTYDEATEIRDELLRLTKKGGLSLRQWASNDAQLISPLRDHNDNAKIKLDNADSTSILGIHWNANHDSIAYMVKDTQGSTRVTKRSMLSQIAQLFDPLGLIGHVIITAKLLMQQLWKTQVDWDESVPTEIQTAWLTYRDQLHALNNIGITRKILIDNHVTLQLHGFCDASEQAYGACIYIRSTNKIGECATRLVCAKSRVAPLKSVSLPRLELCGALLLVRLYRAVARALSHLTFEAVYLWSDSTIALTWIKTAPHTLKTFVANRVAEIQGLNAAERWRHVPSLDNPADLCSRGIMPTDIKNHPIWYDGPSWINLPETEWPSLPLILEEVPEKRSLLVCTVTVGACDIFEKFSSITRLKRVIAYCRRFAHNTLCTRRNTTRLSGTLTINELEDALLAIIKRIQAEVFANERKIITDSAQLRNSIAQLSPFIDTFGVLRVGGRISRANLPYSTKHPALLPQKHHVTTLIIRHAHLANYHAGVQATLAILREKYWVINGRSFIQNVLRKCVTCCRAKPRIPEHLMGDLPKGRVTYNRPFESVGIDYCGPIFIKEKRLRNRNKVKIYIAIFVCLAVKAVHIEIVSDLTTDAFIAALKRFVARRGRPSHIYSDNATNFVGANRELKELYDSVLKNSRSTNDHLAEHGITWHFIPPRSPHFGGLWEAAVKGFKYHFTRVIGETLLTYEALHTYTTEIEAIMNSRPLTPLSSDPTDLNPLTPAHFLIGGPLTSIAESNLPEIHPSRLSMYEHVKHMRESFWKRWHKEYLHELTVRKKWHTNHVTDIQVGTMVILHEDNVPPIRWQLGRVIETHPGADGIIRVVTVKAAHGNYKRSIKKLAPLFLSDSDV